MTFSAFQQLVTNNPAGVVLLEGRRKIPETDQARATGLARELARKFPSLRFRSSNAKGSDEAFCNGVAEVDPARLEIITPYAGHRKKAWKKSLAGLEQIRWLRKNSNLWEGRAMNLSVVQRRNANITLTANVIKQAYGPKFTPAELRIKDQYLESQRSTSQIR